MIDRTDNKFLDVLVSRSKERYSTLTWNERAQSDIRVQECMDDDWWGSVVRNGIQYGNRSTRYTVIKSSKGRAVHERERDYSEVFVGEVRARRAAASGAVLLVARFHLGFAPREHHLQLLLAHRLPLHTGMLWNAHNVRVQHTCTYTGNLFKKEENTNSRRTVHHLRNRMYWLLVCIRRVCSWRAAVGCWASWSPQVRQADAARNPSASADPFRSCRSARRASWNQTVH